MLLSSPASVVTARDLFGPGGGKAPHRPSIEDVPPPLEIEDSLKSRAVMFANISNHPTHSWSVDQFEAATRLGHGPPCDLEKLLLHVDAYATTSEVANIADSTVERMG